MDVRSHPLSPPFVAYVNPHWLRTLDIRRCIVRSCPAPDPLIAKVAQDGRGVVCVLVVDELVVEPVDESLADERCLRLARVDQLCEVAHVPVQCRNDDAFPV